MVDAEPMVALPCAGLIIPIGPHPALRIMRWPARRSNLRPSKRPVGCDALGLAQGVVEQRGGRPDVRGYAGSHYSRPPALPESPSAISSAARVRRRSIQRSL
jgi:hypothetical protein